MSFLQGMGISINAGKDIERKDRADRMAGMEEEQARDARSLNKKRELALMLALQLQQERKSGAQGGTRFGGLYDDSKVRDDIPSAFGPPKAPPSIIENAVGAFNPEELMKLKYVSASARPPYAAKSQVPGFADGGPVRVPPNVPNGVVNAPSSASSFAPAMGAMPPWMQGYMRGGPVRGPGTGTSDSIPARLSDGEFVIPAEVVRRKGTEFFDKLIAGGKK